MNNERRKHISKLVNRLELLRAEFEAIRDEIAYIKDVEEEARDNIPESMQSSERYDNASAACDALDEAHSEMDNFDFDSIISQLESAAQ
jgi:hypothetical protein